MTVYAWNDETVEPIHLDVGPGEVTQTLETGIAYDVTVAGPNRFVREFSGAADGTAAHLDVTTAIATDPRVIGLTIQNAGTSAVAVVVRGLAYSTETARLAVDAGAQSAHVWSPEDADGWYDIEVTVDGDPSFRRRLTGHIENGKPSVTG